MHLPTDTMFSELGMIAQVAARTSGEATSTALAMLLQHYLITSRLPNDEIVIVGFCGSLTSMLTMLIGGFHMAFMHVFSQTERTPANKYIVARTALSINVFIAFVLVEVYTGAEAVVKVFFDSVQVRTKANAFLWASLPGIVALTFNNVLKPLLTLSNQPELKSAVVIAGVILRTTLALAWGRTHGCLGLSMAHSVGHVVECATHAFLNAVFCEWDALHAALRTQWAHTAEYDRVGALSLVTTITSCNYLHATVLLVQYCMDDAAALMHTLMTSMATFEYYTHTITIFNTTWSRILFSAHTQMAVALCTACTAASSALAVVCGMMFGPAVVYVFTNDPTQRAELVTFLPLVTMYCAMEKALACLAGALHGLGQQRRVAVVNTLGYGVVGPCMHLVLQQRYGLAGVWVAMSATSAAMIVASSYMLRRTLHSIRGSQ